MRDGIQKLILGAGVPEKAKMQLKVKGRTAVWPSPVDMTTYFELDPNVIVQLSNDETGECWSTTFTTATKNEPGPMSTRDAWPAVIARIPDPAPGLKLVGITLSLWRARAQGKRRPTDARKK